MSKRTKIDSDEIADTKTGVRDVINDVIEEKVEDLVEANMDDIAETVKDLITDDLVDAVRDAVEGDIGDELAKRLNGGKMRHALYDTSRLTDFVKKLMHRVITNQPATVCLNVDAIVATGGMRFHAEFVGKMDRGIAVTTKSVESGEHYCAQVEFTLTADQRSPADRPQRLTVTVTVKEGIIKRWKMTLVCTDTYVPVDVEIETTDDWTCADVKVCNVKGPNRTAFYPLHSVVVDAWAST